MTLPNEAEKSKEFLRLSLDNSRFSYEVWATFGKRSG